MAAGFVARSLVLLGACLVAMPFTLVMPRHVQMRVAQKLAYCAGVVTAYIGVSMFRDRD